MGALYLLHYHAPLANSKTKNRHYLGYAEHDAERRIEQHRRGNAGAAFTTQAHREGIAFDVAATWADMTKEDERHAKRMKQLARYCPVCRPGRTRSMPPKRRTAARTAVVGVDMATGADYSVRVAVEPATGVVVEWEIVPGPLTPASIAAGGGMMRVPKATAEPIPDLEDLPF